MVAPCEHLLWDSEFFGRRIARVKANRANSRNMKSILAWCEANKIECLYLLADSGDGETSRLAQSEAFRLVDVRMTFHLRISEVTEYTGSASGLEIRPFRMDDFGQLRPIVRSSHRGSRFYSDGGFDKTRCDDLYETWLERSCQGWADRVFVADAGSGPIGYCSCHLGSEGTGRIGLIGVSGAHTKKGYGRQLTGAAISFLASQGMRRVEVVTQGSNCEAQRMYQACGFRTELVQLWFHRWFV